MAINRMDALLEQLHALADDNYRRFNEGLIPGAEGTSLGVRMPALRKIAREILKDDVAAFLDASLNSAIHELKLLHAIVLAKAPFPADERYRRLHAFVPTLDNWAVCDILCGDWKPAAAEKPILWNYAAACMRSKEEYAVRFGAVILMSYFRASRAEEVLRLYADFRHEGYYAQMAVAWGLSFLFVDHRELTLNLLKTDSLDRFTHNKAIQKTIESYRVTPEDKRLLRTLRR